MNGSCRQRSIVVPTENSRSLLAISHQLNFTGQKCPVQDSIVASIVHDFIKRKANASLVQENLFREQSTNQVA